MIDILHERDEMVADFCGGRVPTQDEIRRTLGHHDTAPELRPLARPCRKHGKNDCAVVGDLYSCFSAMLSLLPPDEIEKHSLKWFCHNHPGRACAGNIEYQRRVSSPHKEGG